MQSEINRSLDDVILLLEREIERLKTALQAYRLSSHPERAAIIRWHVNRLDERQDRLDELRAMIAARSAESRQGHALH